MGPLLVCALLGDVPGGVVAGEGVPRVDDIGVIKVEEHEGVGVVHVGAELVGHANGGEHGGGGDASVQGAPPDAVDAPGDDGAGAPGQDRVLAQEALAELHSAHPAHGAQGEGHGVESEPRENRVTFSQLGDGPGNKKRWNNHDSEHKYRYNEN